MVYPLYVPEFGIECYAFDNTQGPTCSIMAPAATAFRNYLVPFPDGSIGQTTTKQIK